MTATLQATISGTTANVNGAGFDLLRTAFVLDGVAATGGFYPKSDGSFSVGVPVKSTSVKLVAQQLKSGLWVDVVSVSLSQPAPAPTPTPTPSPAPGGVKKTLGPSATAAQFVAALSDMTIDVLELSPGTYKLAQVRVAVNRASRPLTVIGNGLAVFTGNVFDNTRWGQFYCVAPTGYITFDGFVFDGYTLDQAGIWEFRSTDHVTVRNMTYKNIKRGPTSDTAYKTWAAYISMDGSKSNKDMVLDNWKIVGNAKQHSGIQIDSSTVAESNITIKNITISDCDYAFYENVPTTNLLLDTWNITNTAHNGTAISFHQASGVYKNIHGGTVAINSSRMVSGGGNT